MDTEQSGDLAGTAAREGRRRVRSIEETENLLDQRGVEQIDAASFRWWKEFETTESFHQELIPKFRFHRPQIEE